MEGTPSYNLCVIIFLELNPHIELCTSPEEKMTLTSLTLTTKESTMVCPANDTPNHCLRLSNLDIIAPPIYMFTVQFYRRGCISDLDTTTTEDFFEAGVLKEALSKALVPFYPVAGRFRRDEDGRLEIDCNGEGVLFVEAETNWVVDDFGDFSPSLDLQSLVPSVDYSAAIDSYPLMLVQVTHFKCGGVSLGIGMHHTAVDGASAFHLITTWSYMARGLDHLVVPPFLDRSLLSSRDPPLPSSDLVEYHHSQLMKTPANNNKASSPFFSVFKMSASQVDALIAKATKEEEDISIDKTYSTYELLTGHVWRCVSKARGLLEDQETRLYTFVNGRTRLRPVLPPSYVGNVVFPSAAIATSGDIVSKPLRYSASKIHESVVRVDDQYLRSVIDYWELQPGMPDALGFLRGTETSKCPNIAVSTWTRLSVYEADFGWGKPVYVGPCFAELAAGTVFILPSPGNEGSFSFFVSLQPDEMEGFAQCFYEI